jgi:hypothetical protein
MTIYTGYFAHTKKYPFPISIARSSPQFFNGIHLSWLEPSYELLNTFKTVLSIKIDRLAGKLVQPVSALLEAFNDPIDYYTKVYVKEVLGHISPEEVYERISKVSNGKDCTLLCYEKPDNTSDDELEKLKHFCHRHIVSAFLRSGGFDSHEFEV